MRTRSWVAPLAAAILCLAVVAPVAAKDPVRPFGGHAFGADVASAPTGACAGYTETDTVTGQGEFLHLGLATFTEVHCTTIDFATMSGTFDQGFMTLTAANGDQLFVGSHGTFQVTASPGPISHASIWWTITGGTGRFAGARGSGTGNAVLDILTGSGPEWLTGTISY